jgi:hypothetical protein
VSDDAWVFHNKSDNIEFIGTKNASYFNNSDHDWDQFMKLRQLSLLEIKNTLNKASDRKTIE